MYRILLCLVLLCSPWRTFAGEAGGNLTPLERILQNLAKGLDQAGSDADRRFQEAQTQTIAVVFEHWLIQSRNAVLSTGASSIPPSIRQQLQGFYPDDLLDHVRFKIGDTGALNLANLSMQYGDAAAVTLIDVIVFKNAEDAYNNTLLWAHELKHVQQFRDWGTGGFVLRYLRNWNSIEDEAYATADAYQHWSAQMAQRPRHRSSRP